MTVPTAEGPCGDQRVGAVADARNRSISNRDSTVKGSLGDALFKAIEL